MTLTLTLTLTLILILICPWMPKQGWTLPYTLPNPARARLTDGLHGSTLFRAISPIPASLPENPKQPQCSKETLDAG